jgi:phosphatidylinositol alpha-1,6-mannosyltransferase
MKFGFSLVSFDYPPLEGGISRLCCAIVDELKLQGHKISAVSRETSSELDAFTAPDVDEFRVSKKRGKAEWQLFWHLLRHKRKNIVVSGVWYPEGLIAALAGCKNLVLLVHGNEVMPGRPTFKNRLLSRLRRWVIKRSNLVISNSDYTATLVRTQCPNANVVTIPLGVDHKRFVPKNSVQIAEIRQKFGLDETSKLVLTTSRVQAYKGHDVVLKAIASIPEILRSDVIYLVAGRGEHLAALKEQAKSLGIDKQLRWLGFVSDESLPALYAAVDLFVLCTREEKQDKQVEGFGLVFLEAQSCGIPVVGVRQGGIPNAVIPKQGGWLIDRDDHASLAKIIGLLQSAPEDIKRQGGLARERVLSEATWTIYGQRVIECITENFQE